MNRLILIFSLCIYSSELVAQQPIPVKPRILISTDIGGSDPDNQSMAHLLMYSEMFNIEGLVSSPSYGNGSKEEILRMINLYEKDLPKLKKHQKDYPTQGYLRSITKQGRYGNAPYVGYTTATEGSNWIIKCAKKKSTQSLWILCWGGLEDLAQALCLPGLQFRAEPTIIPHRHIAVIVVRKYVSNFKDDEEPNI